MHISIRTRNACCDQSNRDPDLPRSLEINKGSVQLALSAPMGCSFTGVVHMPSRCIYLFPLVATRAGNVDIGQRQNLHFNSMAGNLGGDVKPILHPNLTPKLRAQAGLTSGHTQICQKFGLNQNECIGFALSKERLQYIMTTSSQTLNSEKFKFLSARDIANLNSPKAVVSRFAQQQLVNKLGTGHMSKEWADLIARTLCQLPSGHQTPFGSYESPI